MTRPQGITGEATRFTSAATEIEAQIAAVEEGHELAFRVFLDLDILLVYLPRGNWNDIAAGDQDRPDPVAVYGPCNRRPAS